MASPLGSAALTPQGCTISFVSPIKLCAVTELFNTGRSTFQIFVEVRQNAGNYTLSWHKHLRIGIGCFSVFTCFKTSGKIKIRGGMNVSTFLIMSQAPPGEVQSTLSLLWPSIISYAVPFSLLPFSLFTLLLSCFLLFEKVTDALCQKTKPNVVGKSKSWLHVGSVPFTLIFAFLCFCC